MSNPIAQLSASEAALVRRGQARFVWLRHGSVSCAEVGQDEVGNGKPRYVGVRCGLLG